MMTETLSMGSAWVDSSLLDPTMLQLGATGIGAVAALWLLTFALHAGLLLLLAWTIDRVFGGRADRIRHAPWRESMWRTALFGGVLTATVQIASGLPSLGGRWQVLPITQASLAEVKTAPTQTADSAAGIAVRTSAPASSAQTPVPLTTKPRAADSSAPLRAAAPAASGQSRTMQASHTTQSKPMQRWFAWPVAVVGVWLAGALIALTRLCANLIRLRRILNDASHVTDAALTGDLALLAQYARIAPPQLYRLPGIASPLAASRARVVLPDWAIETLDRAQLRAMLAHELAHIARADPLWKLSIALWRALFWFLPFVPLAQRRLDEIAELACDAFAARAVGGGRDLAECLAACAERHVRSRTFALAPAMAARESSFMQRIEHLLEGVSTMETEHKSKIFSAVSRIGVFAVLVASAACLPALGFDAGLAHAGQDQPGAAKRHAQGSSHVSVHSDDDRDSTVISMSDDEHKFSASIDGKIAFTADENDVASLDAGGKATFEETRGGTTRRAVISEHQGKLERHYYVDDHEQAFDDAARVWFAKIVIEVGRSGVGAEAREQRLYQSGGAKRVLDEIAQIHSDYARSVYFRLLLAHGKLSPDELDRALKLAGDAQTDYERRQQMQALFAAQPLDASQQLTFLHQTLRFESDYERAELLVGIVPSLIDRNDVRQAWLDATLGVKTDYERRRALEAMLARSGLDDAQLGSVIKASASMSSDYERRSLLVAAIRQSRDADALAPLYASSVQGLGSDHERREALLALIRSGKLGSSGSAAVLDTTAKLGSDYERRQVLVALARVMPDDAALQQRYRDVASKLSPSDRAEAERALIR